MFIPNKSLLSPLMLREVARRWCRRLKITRASQHMSKQKFYYLKMKFPSVVTKTALVGAFLNVFLALMLSPYATPEQIKPPNGAAALDMLSQFMHMIVHHKQVLFMSSLIVFCIVYAARAIEHKYFPFCAKEKYASHSVPKKSPKRDPYFQNFQYMK